MSAGIPMPDQIDNCPFCGNSHEVVLMTLFGAVKQPMAVCDKAPVSCFAFSRNARAEPGCDWVIADPDWKFCKLPKGHTGPHEWNSK